MNTSEVKAEIAQTYDERAEGYKDKDFVEIDGELRVPERNSAYFFVKRKVEYAMKMSGATRDMKALEVGCSLGQMTVLLAPKFNDLTAIDISPKCVDLLPVTAQVAQPYSCSACG